MIAFIGCAVLLAALATGLIAFPLLRRSPSQLAPAGWTALISAGVLVVGSSLLYFELSNWSWRKSPGIDSPESMIERLLGRLNTHPDDLDGWLMLGRSYVALQEYPLAVRAYARADRVAGGRSAEALVGEAEALALPDDSELSGRAGQLVERALAIDPGDPHALFFGAAAAVQRGDLTLGRARFTRLLAMNPPASVKAILERQIAGIDDRLSAGSAAPTTAVSAATQDRPPASAAIRVTLRLAPALRSRVPAGAPLYVFVRDAARPGPPLAVKRLASRFPQSVELTAADSMVPGLSLALGQRVEVIARIAPSGNPMPESGDLFGEAADRVGHDGRLIIVIDQVTP